MNWLKVTGKMRNQDMLHNRNHCTIQRRPYHFYVGAIETMDRSGNRAAISIATLGVNQASGCWADFAQNRDMNSKGCSLWPILTAVVFLTAGSGGNILGLI
jgi:hypothetical protein